LNRYYAQKAYLKVKQSLSEDSSREERKKHEKLKTAAQTEKVQNLRESQRVFGTIITYGQTVQVC